MGLVRRVTRACAETTIWLAIYAASTPRCGTDTWAPSPWTRMRNQSTLALFGPGIRTSDPTGTLDAMWMPKERSASSMFPPSMIGRAP